MNYRPLISQYLSQFLFLFFPSLSFSPSHTHSISSFHPCIRTKWKGWSPLEHKLFPKDLRSAVRAMLLCQNRIVYNEIEKDVSCQYNQKSSDKIQIDKREERRIYSDTASSSSNYFQNDTYMTSSDSFHIESLSSEEDSSLTEYSLRTHREPTEFDLSSLTLHLLPKYLVYNILEFMVSRCSLWFCSNFVVKLIATFLITFSLYFIKKSLFHYALSFFDSSHHYISTSTYY